ncbi:bifunctional DNA primase/polymerase [Streptomyces litchfieldiae]|uniref:Bifunctional DNA primase/polymerase n=1 Tax=Streptomyces litchfieldiae TaxID=3075543 RepID=A0ABU2MI05_9ACTN|nr:bifunctional DNA primase/polymerase [Streptomyces sp. DSM 44938]MDT0341155.1 bifunctional DNA primase/polymerase [Streptomyces sp. DSM 44938]
MGFTIAGMREIRELRLAARRPGRHGRGPISTAVAEYTGLWGWEVVPGARVRRSAVHPGRIECSCGRRDCPAPGAHPLAPDLAIPAGTTLERALRAWERTPDASVLLPTGHSFDVLEVPAPAARRALPRLERMGLPPGPVALAPHGRAWFLVAPGAAAELPGLLYRMGWDGALLDLRALGAGRHITAPPSDHAGRGPVRWLRAPDLESAAAPPRARLLLGTLAYACHRA